MTHREADVFISGAGIAGLVMAAALERLGLSIVVADPSPPQTARAPDTSDMRSTAFLAPARALLDEIGAWSDLAPYAEPLDMLRVLDCRGTPPAIATRRDFGTDGLSFASFGWNIPNARTRDVLSRRVAGCPGVDLRFGDRFETILTRDDHALITLASGARIRARLAIAADGRDSPLRQACGISVQTTRYGQKALAFTVSHDLPHENVSTELYLHGGAFTLVPLPNDESGGAQSAVVWMNDGADAARLMGLDADSFSATATERSCGVLGDLRLAGSRQSWPVVTQRATHLTAKRVALAAEAAHVLPPIGAQGLNTSLHDVRCLVDLSNARPEHLGDQEFLQEYETLRSRDIRLRAAAVDLYNRVCKSQAVPIQALRALGLKLVHDVAPLRHGAIAAGLGTTAGAR